MLFCCNCFSFFYFRGVGFLRYFQVKQLPNFLLASPVLSLAFCSIVLYASTLPKVFQSLRKGRIVLYPVGDNRSSDSTSQSNYRLSAKPVEGNLSLDFTNIACHEMGIYITFFLVSQFLLKPIKVLINLFYFVKLLLLCIRKVDFACSRYDQSLILIIVCATSLCSQKVEDTIFLKTELEIKIFLLSSTNTYMLLFIYRVHANVT